MNQKRAGQLEVALAALAFAASVPASKPLLDAVTPLSLSGVLYISAGLFCAASLVVSRSRESRARLWSLERGDWLWLGPAVVFGGVLGPLLLLLGLRLVSGYAAGLLLNFESVFTVLLGMVFAREHMGARGTSGMVLVIAGAFLLAAPAGSFERGPVPITGVMLIIGACALWGLDSNLTLRVSARDAREVVAVKGLIGGAASLLFAAVAGGFGEWTTARALGAVVLGVVSYGLSITLYIRGLRHLGVLQTGSIFALAPAFAAVLSWLSLGEHLDAWRCLALFVMSGGGVFIALDRHEHAHVHEGLTHAHPHEHDEHHVHPHTDQDLARTPHAHGHSHPPLRHSHPHVHDMHHRHGH